MPVKTIALIPVYNEAATLLSVLDPVSSRVNHVVVVDDGSVDGSLDLARGCRGAGISLEVLSAIWLALSKLC